jgi:hypothetical protein
MLRQQSPSCNGISPSRGSCLRWCRSRARPRPACRSRALTPVSKKDLPGHGSASCRPANLAIASMPSAAIFSGYCCEVAPITPSLTEATPGQPPSTETMDVVLLAGGLQRLVGAFGGGFVDRVNDVDVRVALARRFSIAVRPPSSFALVTSWPTMRGSSSSPMRAAVLHVDAEAHHEALVAQDVDRVLSGVRFRNAILAFAASFAQRRGGPGADQAAGFEVVGREGDVRRVGRVSGVSSAMTRSPASRALARRADDGLRVGGGDQDALGAGRDAAFDGGDLAVMVAVHLSRIGLEVDAQSPPWLRRLPSSSRRRGWCRSW